MTKSTISVDENNAPIERVRFEEVVAKLTELANSFKAEIIPVTGLVNVNGNELIIGLGIDPILMCSNIPMRW